jgi:hypothetical protein
MPTASTVQTENNPSIIVARPIADLDASGSAALTTLEQVSVSVDYDDKYVMDSILDDAKKLANAFTLDGSGADFSCTLSSKADFVDVLARNMATATCSKWTSAKSSIDSTGKVLKTALYDEMAGAFKKIFEDALPNILESDWELTNGVAYEAGADAMADLITATEAEILAQQFPESNYVLYQKGGNGADKEDPVTKALPVKGGDSLVFVFNVKQLLVSRVDKKTAGSTSDANVLGSTTTSTAGAAPGPGQASLTIPSIYGTGVQQTQYAANNRLVAFQFNIPGSGALALK